MQFLISEIVNNLPASSGPAKVFENVKDALKYITKVSRGKKIRLNNKEEVSQAALESALHQRLATAVITIDEDPGRRWVVTAF